MTVLVLTQPIDTAADPVVQALNDRDVPVFRMDTGDFPADVTLSARFTGKRWEGELSTPHRCVALEDIRSVYYRRPAPFRLAESMSGPEREWAEREARHGLGGVLTSLGARWVNHPHADARASYKPHQLAEAAAAGLSVLPTLVTNDPDAARTFVSAYPDGAVYKTLAGSAAVVGHTHFTATVTAEAAGADTVRATAHQFQERVGLKAFEVRLTVIGDKFFAARINAHSREAANDWRSDYRSITYDRIDTPGHVRASVAALMNRLGLRFGAADFIVTPGGRWVFLEINPAGQWGWIQAATGYPIAEAIADDLQQGERS